jgi:hypothetical protein
MTIGLSYPCLLFHVAYAMDVIKLVLSHTYLLGLFCMQSTLNVRLVWLDKVDNLSGLLQILGLTNLGGPSLVKKAPSHSYTCGELQHGFELSASPFFWRHYPGSTTRTLG